MINNSTRAAWARTAIQAYTEAHQCDDNDTQNISDLICDLLHLARLTAGCVDTMKLAISAASMNKMEVEEDPDV